ncbi:GntR family transcriptional regulator [Streptomyces sp. TM32]|uniref:GntR family transcriptional regulator n=1 Tax=Streptomyces sp. TM32 TaxID=1652669 RepID=UPI001011F803|nr:GntR family transcriptional regulator [Streptomyces sp. TM32]RXS84472.1 GntR family transcriptional regulator [Streptomyces sp. TM32]
MSAAAQSPQPLAAVRERVHAELRERIISGELEPGSRLVEREVAERFGVSRLPVREAIRTLTAEGFLAAESARRIVVRRLTRKDVDELFELREALEGYIAGLAAKRASPDDLKALRDLLDQAARATERQRAAEILDINNRFHERILALADNSAIAKALHSAEGRMRWITRQNREWSHLLEEHQQLYEAIASRDARRATAYALQHVRVNRLVTLRTLFGPEDDPDTEHNEGER